MQRASELQCLHCAKNTGQENGEEKYISVS